MSDTSAYTLDSTHRPADGARSPDESIADRAVRSGPPIWVFVLAVVVGALVLAGGLVFTTMTVDAERGRLRGAAQARAEAVLAGRMDRVVDWLVGRQQSLSALAQGDALRIIATELRAARAEGREVSVSTELTFLRTALDRQAAAFGATGLTLTHPDGVPWLVVGDAGPDLAERPGIAIQTTAETGRAVIAEADDPSTRAVDVMVPVASLQEPDRAVGVMAGRFPVVSLAEALNEPDALALPGERVHVVWPDTEALAAPVAPPKAAPDDAPVLSLIRQPEGLSWHLRYTRPLDAILSESRPTLIAGRLLSGAAAITAVMLILGVAWRQGTQNNRTLAEQYQQFATQMAAERHLLDTIVDGITEYLFVVDAKARVLHANAAARDLVGASLGGLLGHKLVTLLDDRDTATLLLAGTPEGRRSKPISCTLGGQSRWVMVLRNPLARSGAEDSRWVILIQDVTDLVHERRRTDTLQRAVVRALSRTVSAADPYLADQAARMERIALLIADEMGVDGDPRLTIELTAQVSQVGKLFVPRDLLTKTERLTEDERAVLQSHIKHACALLDDLHTSLPISRTLTEITERMDGSGYPNGRTGETLSLPGRILAVADVFSARTAERSYRQGARPTDILDILNKMPDRYDPAVLAALTRIVESGRY
ncbi:HD domain-containing phosphohydrolase [uncultured Rhodospira sp.]|uniref:HD domain-containing phosphohydrolase n=1 Tax=uncultured Rhodospira sp. TaxID=1936189 RepID=UPI00262EFFCC|nr:HD domain-containing phosphohydrolase [uncultured Rhodospira sp.]